MCRVIGRILIFVFGLAMIVLGISELIYFFSSYINYLSPTEIAISGLSYGANAINTEWSAPLFT